MGQPLVSTYNHTILISYNKKTRYDIFVTTYHSFILQGLCNKHIDVIVLDFNCLCVYQSRINELNYP